MKDTGKERQIYVRPFGVWKPMKSRMFDTNQHVSSSGTTMLTR